MKGGAIANCVHSSRCECETPMMGGYIAKCVSPLGMIGTPMSGGAIANFVDPLDMIGMPMKGGVIPNFLHPLGMIGTPVKGGAIANCVSPLGMIGNADGWLSYRQLCVPSRYYWGRR